jgi:hypothetical protein
LEVKSTQQILLRHSELALPASGGFQNLTSPIFDILKIGIRLLTLTGIGAERKVFKTHKGYNYLKKLGIHK